MDRILIAVLLLVPMASGGWFSDFDVIKWSVAAILAAAGVGLVLRRKAPIRQPLMWTCLWAGLVVVAAASWLSARRLELPPTETLRELLRLGTPWLVAFAAANASLGRAARQRVIVAGALAPTLVLTAEILLSSGFNPVGTPHRAGTLTSTLGNTAFVGEMALMSLPFVLLLEGRGRWRWWPVAAAGLPCAFLIWASDARSSWIGAAVLVTAWFGLRWWLASSPGREPAGAPRGQRLAGPLLAAAVGVVAVGALVQETAPDPIRRLATVVDPAHPTNRVRVELWSDARRMIADRPWLGVGAGRFGLVHPRYRGADEWNISGIHTTVLDPHNEVLCLLAECGILGTLLLGLLLALLLREVVRPLRRSDDRHRRLAMASLAALAALSVVGLTWAVLSHPATMIPLGVLVGTTLGGRGDAGAPRWAVWSARAGSATLAAGLLVFALMWLERDTACVALRDRAESVKAKIAERQRGEAPTFAAGLVAELGETAEAMLRAAESPLVTQQVRHRLDRTLFDLAGQRRVLLALVDSFEPANGLEKRNRVAIGNACRRLPAASEVRGALLSARRQAPYHLPTLRLLAALERSDGRTFEAVQTLESALAINHAAPLVRLRLAEIHGEAKLFARAVALLEDELELYGGADHADEAWELLARSLGAERRLLEALSVVHQWVEARGSDTRRWAVAGELALHLGETASTVGLFMSDPETFDRRAERGAFYAASLDGLDARVRRRRLLAHLGRNPHDVAILDELRDVVKELASRSEGETAAFYEHERKRAISRARVLYAWEHRIGGDPDNARRCARISRRVNPQQGDAWLIELLPLVEDERFDDALSVLRRWKEHGFDEFPALEHLAATRDFMARPEVRRLLGG